MHKLPVKLIEPLTHNTFEKEVDVACDTNGDFYLLNVDEVDWVYGRVTGTRLNPDEREDSKAEYRFDVAGVKYFRKSSPRCRTLEELAITLKFRRLMEGQ